MLPEYFEFCLPTKVIYGIGIIKQIGNFTHHFGIRKAILITDEIIRKAGPAQRVLDGFSTTPIEIVTIFDQVPANSTTKTIEECATIARKNKCDMIIAIGGGSVIDTAKVTNLILSKGGKVEDYMGAYQLDKEDRLFPMIFIPTTSGTGSEVTKVANITDSRDKVKLPFAEDQFLPELAVLDPLVTVSMNRKLTACTGMDAMTHAIEAYVGKANSPASDALALHAIRLINANILRACCKPDDLQARGAMLIGSFLAGVAFSHSMVGMTHGISNALTGIYHISHGLATALILPEVMEFNLDVCQDRYADIAIALGITFPQVISESQSILKASPKVHFLADKFLSVDTVLDWLNTKSFKARGLAANALGNLGFIDQWFRKQAAFAAIEKIRTMLRQLSFLTKIPLNLNDAGITDNLAKIQTVANIAMQDGAMLFNPKEPTLEVITQIVNKAYASKLTALPVSEEDLRTGLSSGTKQDLKNVFKNSEMLYNVLIEFFEELKSDDQIGPALKNANMVLQFRFTDPEAVITIDATSDDLKIIKGEHHLDPEVTMSMNADFAHQFWHGRANLLTALTRRMVNAKGNIPKIIKLLPILKPAFDLYPVFLKQKGLESIIIY